MFKVKCLRTGKTLTLDHATVLIILRQFTRGYELFFKTCSMNVGDITDITNELSELQYSIERVK